ncbi:MAG: 23S rRNA (guanosine(2251)-2'-O)-methyltransferase RlmB [Anaerolineaceae bacterium]|nr:23S rRNA (guanosine(2251)-2'-O)-methyltransferase RlmB [Anaerolineaceae bacterium]MCY4009543.1 23S rRNA (guanosine(2251)-2'-O)-methyltransferase RlmB [Anaerolineaceae bacterium]MCY4105673.1 23S rRNA (guanosine(2251)-2'-O)-methyltransferase RlmB [Chloroflexota bacterium]
MSRRASTANGSQLLYGHWSVLEAIRAQRRPLEQLLLTEGVEERGKLVEILQLARSRGLRIRRIPRNIMDDITNNARHQHTALRVGPYPYVELDHILQKADALGERPLLLILDLLKDPQNVGVLLRIADSVGVHGIMLQERRSVGITPAVISSSSGAAEHLNIARVTNLVQTMRELREDGIWLVGLDTNDQLQPLDAVDLNVPLGLVLGSEGEGMRRLVRENCDVLATLPMRGRVASLNVATAGSIALYSAWNARSWEGWHGTAPRLPAGGKNS